MAGQRDVGKAAACSNRLRVVRLIHCSKRWRSSSTRTGGGVMLLRSAAATLTTTSHGQWPRCAAGLTTSNVPPRLTHPAILTATRDAAARPGSPGPKEHSQVDVAIDTTSSDGVYESRERVRGERAPLTQSPFVLLSWRETKKKKR
ncbi:hypothetical protein EYF80_012012 [Liparis tanakae]|uniref:Uncharacterized protein n=1 Tax=Liparis tanakae TaxID=230148 RepID=A0A4Z2IJR9_9TELE|nr:hypothetical protein EYF80_012012 [Liparis tanakae]